MRRGTGRRALVLAGVVVAGAVAALTGAADRAAAGVTLVVPGAVGLSRKQPTPVFSSRAASALLEVAGGPVLYARRPRWERPIASLTKIMTAYLVLQNPAYRPQAMVTITPAEAQHYRQGLANGDSEVPLAAGQRVDEYALLQALMLPSADDAAWVLADRFGGAVAFVRRMNRTAARLGMHRTVYADPDGVSPATRSDAADLLRLTAHAMKLQSFRRLVATASVQGPLGTLQNLNQLLGWHGVDGVKTGWTPQAGYGLVFAARLPTGAGAPALPVYGVVLGEPSFAVLFADVRQLLRAAAAIPRVTVWRAGQEVGVLRLPGGQVLPLLAARSVTVWATAPTAAVQFQPVPGLLRQRAWHAGEPAGQLSLKQPGWPTLRVAVRLGAGGSLPWWARLGL